MQIEELRAKYKDRILALAEEHYADNIRVFGSVARGDEKEGSDIDFLVHFRPGISDQYDLSEALKTLLKCPVHVVSDRTIDKYLRDRIMTEAVPLNSDIMATTEAPMKEEKDRVRLQRIHEACEKIGIIVQRDSRDWEAEYVIAHAIGIIGDQTNKVSDETKNKYPEVDWDDAYAMRNRITHEYSTSIHPEKLWEVAATSVPEMKNQMEEIIAELNTKTLINETL